MWSLCFQYLHQIIEVHRSHQHYKWRDLSRFLKLVVVFFKLHSFATKFESLLSSWSLWHLLILWHHVTYCKQELVPVHHNQQQNRPNYLSTERQQLVKKLNSSKNLRQKQLEWLHFERRGRKSRQEFLHFRLTTAWFGSVPNCWPICMTKSAFWITGFIQAPSGRLSVFPTDRCPDADKEDGGCATRKQTKLDNNFTTIQQQLHYTYTHVNKIGNVDFYGATSRKETLCVACRYMRSVQ